MSRQEPAEVPGSAAGFVGRRRELDQVRRLLPEARLLTLHGPGGIGKSRLALELAATADQRVPWWVVDLGALAEPALVPALVASTLGLNATEEAPLDLVCHHLADQTGLLVLDTCEHLTAAVSRLAEEIVRRCPAVTVLATSRHRLGLPMEVTYPVPPLSLAPAAETIEKASDAAELFLARARWLDPTFADDLATRAVIDDICRCLDGVPLAIELAAARTRALTVEQIRDRLDDPLPLLSRGTQEAASRQSSLRASLQWSFDLCDPAEQELWLQLSSFAGSFDLDTIEVVCGRASGDGTSAYLDLVQSLTEKSILTPRRHHDRMRYRMLDTMRAFAREQHGAAPAAVALGRAQVAWYAEVARRLEEDWVGPGQAAALARAEADLPNIRQAIEWCLHHGELDSLYELVLMPTAQLWWTAGHVDEGRYWLHRILEAVDEPSELRARALRNGVTLALAKGDLASVGPTIAEATAIQAQLPPAERRPGTDAFITGFGHIMRHDYGQAVAVIAPAVEETLTSAPRPLDLQLRQMLIYAHTGLGADDEALAACEDLLSVSAATGEEYYRAFALQMQALYALAAGETARAHELIAAAFAISRSFPNRPENPDGLMTAGMVAAVEGDVDRARTLFGAAVGTAQTVIALTQAYLAGHPDAADLQALHAGLSGSRAEPAWQAGRRMSPQQAADFVTAPAALTLPARPTTRLTPRELEVARLVAEGRSDRQIAEHLSISIRTAEGHVARILTKLGGRSRHQIGRSLIP